MLIAESNRVDIFRLECTLPAIERTHTIYFCEFGRTLNIAWLNVPVTQSRLVTVIMNWDIHHIYVCKTQKLYIFKPTTFAMHIQDVHPEAGLAHGHSSKNWKWKAMENWKVDYILLYAFFHPAEYYIYIREYFSLIEMVVCCMSIIQLCGEARRLSHNVCIICCNGWTSITVASSQLGDCAQASLPCVHVRGV